MFKNQLNDTFDFNANSELYDPKFTKSALDTQSIFKASKKSLRKRASKLSFIDSFFDEKGKMTNLTNFSQNFENFLKKSNQVDVYQREPKRIETPKKKSRKSRIEEENDLEDTNSKKSRNSDYVYVQGFEQIIIQGGFSYRERYKRSLKLRYIGEKYFHDDNNVLTARIILDDTNQHRILELGLTLVKKKFW